MDKLFSKHGFAIISDVTELQQIRREAAEKGVKFEVVTHRDYWGYESYHVQLVS